MFVTCWKWYPFYLKGVSTVKKMFVLLGMSLLLFGSTVQAQLNDEEKAEGFVSMFNGKDLNEWEGNPDLWSVQDGCIVGQTGAEGPTKLTYNQFLIWKGDDVDDFVIRLDIKLTKDGNSGFQYRSWAIQDEAKPYRVSGYQADFDGSHAHSGILYGEGFGGILCQRGLETSIEDVDGKRTPKTVRRFAENEALKKELKVEDWNSYEITAKGFTFTNKINGHVMSISTDNSSARKSAGIFAVQAHVGPPMKVEIKNIRIKRLKK